MGTTSKLPVFLHSAPPLVMYLHKFAPLFFFPNYDSVFLQEVTGALLENAGEKISGSAIKLIEASGSAIINSGAQVQEGKGVTTDRSAAEAATGRPRERVTLGRFMIQSCVGSPETEV